MSILIRMELVHKHVLIVGGGKVALRKAKEYILQGAQVTITAKEFLHAFHDLNAVLIHASYHQRYLEKMELVYAATDDARINEQIVCDAKAKGIPVLCAQASFSDLQSVISYETADIQIGVSTKGSYPSLNRRLLERLQLLYETEYQAKMPLLKALRKLVLDSQLEQSKAYALLNDLVDQPLWFLSFFKDALTYKRACILAFHGVKFQECVEQEILPFLSELKDGNTAFGFAYLSHPVMEILQKQQVSVWSLEALLSLLTGCGVSTRVYPMLLQDGRFYDQIKTACNQYHALVMPLPLQDLSSLQELMDLLYAAYARENSTLMILYHSSPSGNFASYVNQLTLPRDMIIIQASALHQTHVSGDSVILLSLSMLSGYHMQTDGNACKKLREQKEVRLIQQSCMVSSVIKTVLKDRIQAALKKDI